MPLYQVWECTTVAGDAAFAITRSDDNVESAALASRSLGSG
ncbi:Uncharacterised protein [Mycobacterium tuberculosis]|nr:Uncharacterised protein [Mycobacterium tuberculosis]